MLPPLKLEAACALSLPLASCFGSAVDSRLPMPLLVGSAVTTSDAPAMCEVTSRYRVTLPGVGFAGDSAAAASSKDPPAKWCEVVSLASLTERSGLPAARWEDLSRGVRRARDMTGVRALRELTDDSIAIAD
ncbi:hypothetical protein AB1Y20_003994 [Prymnesium parvum]|uniref:Secreted protein n=1 Tax=Prymnesium parvum TaxID=97485 RepID=A0AB34J8L7_PRYPA